MEAIKQLISWGAPPCHCAEFFADYLQVFFRGFLLLLRQLQTKLVGYQQPVSADLGFEA